VSVQITGHLPDFVATVSVLQAEAVTVMHEALELTEQEMRQKRPGRITEKFVRRVTEVQGGVSGSTRPTARYAKWVDQGSGVHAEHHSPITPKAGRHGASSQKSHAAALGPMKGTQGAVYRRKSKGQIPQKFVERTRESAASRVEETLMRGAEKTVERLAR